MPVPHGGVVTGMLNVDGGGTRDAEDDDSLVEDAALEELADGVGVKDAHKLEDMSAGISLLPSSSSTESGARVQAGPSGVLRGCTLSPSSPSSMSGARSHAGPSVVLGGCSLSPSSLSRSSGAREHMGALLLEVVVVLETVVVVDIPTIPQPVWVASNVRHADVRVSVNVKLIDAMVVGSTLKFSKQLTMRSVTVVSCSFSHLRVRVGSGVGSGPGLGPQPPGFLHWGPPQISVGHGGQPFST